MIETDIVVIGAGPTGLFTVFEAGLLGMRCHLVDSLTKPGGQCAEIYPNKPIYDIPAYPEIMAGELIDKLLEQIKPFSPGYTLGETAEKLSKSEGKFLITTDKNTQISAKVITIAGGLGNFEPRKPVIDDLNKFEDNGVQYSIVDPKKFQGKNVVISGGGDSALDWAVYLANGIASELTLVHRRDSFRGHLDSIDQINKMTELGTINLITNAEVVELIRSGDSLSSIKIKTQDKIIQKETNYWVPLFGLTPKLGPIANWGLNLDKNNIEVDTVDYSTNIEGIYAIGDINTYEGKLNLILSGFHEAALMAHSAFKHVFPEGKKSFKYTTVLGGIKGF